MADRALHVDIDALVDGMVLQRANHLQPGAVTHVRQARKTMSTKIALQDTSILRAVKQCPPFLELVDPIRCLLGMQLRHAPVVEHLAATHRIAEMHLPVVTRVDIA